MLLWFVQPVALLRFLVGRTERGCPQKGQLGSRQTGTRG